MPGLAFSLPHYAYPVLLVTGLAAGLVDAIAGGGGLIALPVLLNFGLPPPLALGTNKLQSACGTLTSSRYYAREGLVDWDSCRLGALFTFAGALLGAWTVQQIDSRVLGRIMPLLLAAVLAYIILRPEFGRAERPARFPRKTFFVLAGLGLGFYDGFFGPGAGSLWTAAIVIGLGFDLSRATGTTKVMNLASNLASLALFVPMGRVDYPAALTMCAGQVLGARIGAGLVVQKGARFIRPVFLTIVALTLARLVAVTWLR